MSGGMGDNKSPSEVEEKQPLAEEDANGTLPGEELDSSKVKFINGGASVDAVVDIDGQTKVPPEEEFVGLTKEELLKYADDPFWKKVRWALFILFGVAWVGMLVAAIVIIALAPKCPPRPKLDWWQKSPIYQVYPRSFKDSNGDGVGDLKGLEQKLDYLRNQLNVTALWLGPVYPSPMVDLGQDVTDFKDIDPMFGTLEEFTHMKTAMHKKGMKLIMDFIPNHVSNQHAWFQLSKKSKADDNEHRDYFIWHDGKETGGARPDPPNNWLSVYGGPAWTWDEERQQYYYHTYLSEQPDLNLRNPVVQEEMKEVMRFWLAKGVDGFSVDSAANLFESANLTNDEGSMLGGSSNSYSSHQHPHTTFQPETYQFIVELREIIDASAAMDGKPKFLMVDSAGGNLNQTMTFYEYMGKPGAHLSVDHYLAEIRDSEDALSIHNLVRNWMQNLPQNAWANWATGGPDYSRVATRMGSPDWTNAITMLTTTLPGTTVTYYGEEIGMHDVQVAWEDTVDPLAKKAGQSGYEDVSRDFQRTPMQWSGKPNAGFSAANSTWLPVANDYMENNVKAQLAHGAGVSNLEVYSQMTLLRQEPSFQWGMKGDAVVDENILSYTRQAEGFKGYLVAINFGNTAATVDFHASNPKDIPTDGIVAAHTYNFDTTSRADDYAVGNVASLTGVYLKPKEGVVFWWEWGANMIADE